MNTSTDKHLPKKMDLLRDVISPEESHSLSLYILDKATSSDSTVTLPYRPDEWDSSGVIQKIYEIAKEYIKQNYGVSGQLEPRQFLIKNTVDSSNFSEEYGDYDSNGEILYSATLAMPIGEDYYGGKTMYNSRYEPLDVTGVDLYIHRCEAINDWKVSKILSGSRLDLNILFQEIAREISYDYGIDQITEDLPDF